MRTSMKSAISKTIQDMLDNGFSTSLTEKELNDVGINVLDVHVNPEDIKELRKKIHLSQSFFAKLLNVSASSVRQRE